MLLLCPVHPPFIPLSPCKWLGAPTTNRTPALTHAGALYKPIQFNSLIWLKTNLTKKREKSIILRLLS